MDADTIVDIGRQALEVTVMLSAPILLSSLAIGLTIAVFQAATSINEMTLSFVPKLVIVILTFGLMSSFMLAQLSDYFHFIFDQITQIS